MITKPSFRFSGHLPQGLDELRQRKQWVAWDYTWNGRKWDKPPRHPQTGEICNAYAPENWSSFDDALAMSRRLNLAGVGYSLSKDDDITGIDLDHCYDPDTQTLTPLAKQVLAFAETYTEFSPSGTGLRLFAHGKPAKVLKNDDIGVEVYGENRYLTVTGQQVAGTPDAIQEAPQTMAFLLGEAEKVRAAKQDKKERATRTQDGNSFFREVNNTALQRLDAWVPTLFPTARKQATGGWRVRSVDLGRDFEEDLSLHPNGIQDFGPEKSRTAIDVVLEYGPAGTVKDAALWLCDAMGADPARLGWQESAKQSDDAPSGPMGKLPLSDYTNALAMVRAHGKDLHYCYLWKKWLVWTGTHWQIDNSGAVVRIGKETIKRLVLSVPELEDDRAQALMSHVKRSLSTSAIDAMVRSAQSEPGVAIQPEEIDTNPWLLNVANGTLDLKTGILREHNRDDLITHCLPTPYDANAECPKWHAYLTRVMQQHLDFIPFLQRAAGYALTGSIREHVMFVLWGSGRNGKNTFVDTLLNLLKSYSIKIPTEMLMAAKHDRHPTEKADLFGKRLAVANETEEGRRLAESFVKESTGDSKMWARRMNEDGWNFNITHKLFLATNHKPVIRGTDDGIWEKIRLVPFSEWLPPEERDKDLLSKLESEFPGILAWAVQGCLDWQRDGLGEPDGVTSATNAYRHDMDAIGQFIADCCITGSDHYRVKATELYEKYKGWTGSDDGMNQKAFGMAMTERGYERSTAKGVRWYIGIGLRVDNQGSRVDDQGSHGLPAQPPENKPLAKEEDAWVDEGRPFFPIKSSPRTRVGYNPDLGLPSSTQGGKDSSTQGESNTYMGRPSREKTDDGLPGQDDLSYTIGKPKHARPAGPVCSMCGGTSGRCSHAMKKRSKR